VKTHSVALLLPLLFASCVLQAGMRAASVHPVSVSNARGAWAGHFGAALEWNPFHVGVEVEGRAERRRSSLFTLGLQLGLGNLSETARIIQLAHLDGGMLITANGSSGFYGGGTFAVPIRLDKPVPISERNRNFRILGSHTELEPFLRYRTYYFDVYQGGQRYEVRHDLSIGLAIRAAYSTDIF
jgi:hypothetical protein